MSLEKRLQGFMPDDQWRAFKEFCQSNGILLDEEADEFGSIFLTHKYSFSVGWEHRQKEIDILTERLRMHIEEGGED